MPVKKAWTCVPGWVLSPIMLLAHQWVGRSVFSTSRTFSLTETILHKVRAIRFGRDGDRVAKTPVRGFCGFPRGWT